MKLLSLTGLAITKDMQNKIVELHLQGLSLRKIEAELNITRPTVTKYLRKHKEQNGITEAPGKAPANIDHTNNLFTEAKQKTEQIKELAYGEWKSSTLSQKEIAQKYGISTPTFCKYVKKMEEK
jgi:transposase